MTRLRTSPLRRIAASLPLLALAACDKPIAIGDANNIVVAAPDSVWRTVRPDLLRALEPRFFSVRDERVFEVTQVSPTSGEWGQLRNVRQLLLIGEPGDPWIAEALEERSGPTPTPPALVQARNVWAQNQLVTVLLLPPGSPAGAAREMLPTAGDTLLQQFERYARSRMFVSGVDSVLADSLRRTLGFSMLIPRVYRMAQPEPNITVFRNDNPDPSQLIREIDVAWQPQGEVPFTPEGVLEWRARLGATLTDPPQVTDPEATEVRHLTQEGRPAIEVQGIWSNPPGGWPAAGPFIARMVQCPERTYLLNAWLYAPGASKYEYMLQLRTLLNTFRCDR